MKVSILKSPAAHAGALRELFAWADCVNLASAWATTHEGSARHWKSMNLEKVKKAVIGDEFAQTEPWVLRQLLAMGELRIGRCQGTFHPKLYIGYRGARARAIVGSANLTAAAFSTNAEISVLLEGSSSDERMKALADFHRAQWTNGEKIDSDWIDAYELKWKLRPLVNRSVWRVNSIDDLRMSWHRYYSVLLSQEDRTPVIRIFQDHPSYQRELDNTLDIFMRHPRFSEIPPEERRILMGLRGKSSGLIGSMDAARDAKEIVKTTPATIGRYLDLIPMDGDVPIALVEEVVRGLLAIKGVKLAVATRLLTVKRPDIFVSVNNGSKPKLKRVMGGGALLKAEHYVDLLKLIWATDWYRSPAPVDAQQRSAWQRRVGLLDAIFYQAVD
jgi:hypothetical protein